MSHNKFFGATAVAAILALVLIFRCELPQDPTDPSNTSVKAVLRTSDWAVSNQSITDTVGNIIQVGAAINLPENIDSLRITFWGAETAPLFDTLVTSFNTQRNDTVWKRIYFVSAGQKTVTIMPYSSLNLPPVTVRITIVDLPGPPNSKPSISVQESVVTGPAEPCSLLIRTSDADVNQSLTVAMVAGPTGAAIEGNSLFRWTPPTGFTGYDTVTFIVADNGKPPLFDTATSVITVTATPHPPVIEVSGNRAIKSLETCTLTLKATDEDAGQLLTIAMVGNPEGAMIAGDSQFIWTAPTGSTGTFDVRFTVTDDGSPRLSSSTIVTITVVDAAVNHAPKWNLDTLPVSLNDTVSYKLQLTTQCGDIDDDPLTYSLLAGLPVGDTIVGSQYSFVATAAAIGRHVAALVVADPAGAKDTLYIALAVESSVTDNTPPVITLIAPAGDSGISITATYTLDVISSDAGGIKSVSATIGSTTIPATLTDGHYLMTVSGLTPGVYTAITISATDASGKANKNTRMVYVKYSQGFTVTYAGNGNSGGTVPVDAGAYEAGATVTVKANTGSLVKTGATFAGWNTAADGSGTAYAAGATFAMGPANDTLYVNWSIYSYTITFDGQNATTPANPTSKIVASPAINIDVLPVAPQRSGYIFGGWYTAVNGGGAEFMVATPVTANDTVYANWNSYSYTIIFDGGAEVAPTTKTVSSPSTTVDALPTPPQRTGGYEFGGWFMEQSYTTPMTTAVQFTANDTVYAKWTKMYLLNVTCVPMVGGSIVKNVDGSTFASGTQVRLTPVASPGYRFREWGADASGSDNPKTITMDRDFSITATFVQQYSLTVTATTGGVITAPSSSPVNVDAGAPTNISASATNTGYRFYVWRITNGQATLDDSLNENTTISLFGGNAAVTAVFKKTVFNKTFGGMGAAGYTVFALPQNKGYMIAGKLAGSSNTVLVRTNIFGDSLWTRSYSCSAPELEGGVAQTSDGGYVMTGNTSNKVTLIKTDSAGVIVWTRTLGPVQVCGGRVVRQTSDGGFIVGGTLHVANPESERKVYILKTNSDGSQVTFEQGYDGVGSTALITDIKQIGSDFVYLAYADFDFGGQSEIRIRKISGTTGASLWEYDCDSTPTTIKAAQFTR